MSNPIIQHFVLGADDPEMREIEHILKAQEQSYEYAMASGKRVHPGNAYKADEVESKKWLVLIECEPALTSAMNAIHLDHHRLGDAGYGMSPAQYWEASSLGQLCSLLDIQTITHDQYVLAAMDHCPANAIRGECPGIKAREIVDRKVQEIALATKLSPSVVSLRIVEFREKLEHLPEVKIGNQQLKDMRSFDTGEGYSLNYLCCQVATLVSGYAVILLTHDRGDTRKKYTIAGHCTPETVQAFMDEWAPSQDLVGIYGVPSRGYAGGYVK
jgi:hypothetical protein